ncbi:MAG: hypothetical protein HY047_15780 [Acidobacteria bacterium]|nr:hypothetical protein [Acidobacteriota bacterium]
MEAVMARAELQTIFESKRSSSTPRKWRRSAPINATHVNDFFGLPGTNKRIEIRHSRLFQIDEAGLIAHERRIYDFTGLLVKVGVLRAKPA